MTENLSAALASERTEAPRPLTWRQWAIVGAAFFIVAAIGNRLLPIPDLNDFSALGRICLLMQEKGLRYCVNGNWGFAHPLLVFVFWKLFGNLLWAERLIAVIFGAGLLIVQERLMRTAFPVISPRARMVGLLFVICSSDMLELLLSIHLDIIPVTLTALAVLLLWKSRPSSYLFAGFVAGAACWFRFHFSVIALLFLVLLFFINRNDWKTSRVWLATGGLVIALLVPSAVARVALDSRPPSNSTTVIAEFAQKSATTVSYEMNFDRLTIGDITSGVDWSSIIGAHLREMLGRPLLVLAIFIVAAQLFSFLRRRPDSGLDQISVAAFYLVSIVPFIFLRGFTLRLEAALLVLIAPYFIFVFASQREAICRGLVAAIVCLALAALPTYLVTQNLRNGLFRRIDSEVRSVIPDEVASRSPDTVLSGVAIYYNRTNDLWLWNPAVIGGWPVRERALRESFGVVDLNRLDPCRLPQSVRYLVLNRTPSYDYERFDPQRIASLGKVHEMPDVVVVELAARPNCAAP